MSLAEVWLLRCLVAATVGVVTARLARRVRLFYRAPDNIAVDDRESGRRLWRFVAEVIFQQRTIAERPLVGVAHLAVFWGFLAFGAYTLAEFLNALGLIDLTHGRGFAVYRWSLVPFAVLVSVGITGLAIRRVVIRPVALGQRVSLESVAVAGWMLTLMVTFLLTFVLDGGGPAAHANTWVHVLAVLGFAVVIPDSKHLHLLLAPATVYLRSSTLATVPNLDFEREEVGLESLADIGRKQVLDAFTCVECGRCQENCPAHATGKILNPKQVILDTEAALLKRDATTPVRDMLAPEALWQCTTCGACERQCPVGVEHLPLIVGARRGLVSNGEAPAALAGVFTHLERRGNIWGLPADSRQKFVTSAGLETFDPARHEYLVWLGCAGAFEPDYQNAVRATLTILRRCGVTFGVLAQERCTGDVAKRSGNEYLFQELAHANMTAFAEAGVTKIVTGCPHCLRTIGIDYRAFGYTVEIVHTTQLVERVLGDAGAPVDATVTYHDPCYLGRYAGTVEEPRSLVRRAGAALTETERHGENPFCCGAGGGLLFETTESGQRISATRLAQLRATGATTILTACPFCTVMLKGAAASDSEAAHVEITDLMTYLERRLSGGGA